MIRRRRVAGTAPVALGVTCALLLASSTAVAVERQGRAGQAVSRAAAAPVPAGPRARPNVGHAPAESRARQAPPPRRVPLVRFAASGQLAVVPGDSPVAGRGRLRRYAVEVEAGLEEDPAAFATTVAAVLGDPRGWTSRLGIAMQRVGSGPVDFRVTLASPATVDRLCRPLDTGGVLSCFMGSRAVVNAARWRAGADTFGEDLLGYRRYLVNHEVGHALGLGHRSCPAPGRPAPVMMQQTKGVGRCLPNALPVVG